MDTWWQTETGSILIAPVPGVTPTKPGSASKALPGIVAEVVDAATGKFDFRRPKLRKDEG